LERSLVCQPLEIHSEFSLCGDHNSEGPQLRDKRLQGRGVWPIGYHMPDGHTPLGLFKGKMAEIGENEGELLFVIGPPGRLPGILHEDNA